MSAHFPGSPLEQLVGPDENRCNGIELGTLNECPKASACARWMLYARDKSAGELRGKVVMAGYSPKWFDRLGCSAFIAMPNAQVHRKNRRSEAKAGFSGATPC